MGISYLVGEIDVLLLVSNLGGGGFVSSVDAGLCSRRWRFPQLCSAGSRLKPRSLSTRRRWWLACGYWLMDEGVWLVVDEISILID
ncbi:hypothetical protein Bca4012_064844 [Brassica carinata]